MTLRRLSIDRARRFAVSCIFAGMLPLPAFTLDITDPRRTAQRILELTNAFRREEDLRALTANAALTSAAQAFAEHMARTDRYGHEADGREPVERASAHGYEQCLVAENIAYYESSSGLGTGTLAHAFVDGWKRSPPHRRNMLDADVVDFGAGVARSDATGRWYGVQLFGLPASARIRFEITNRVDAPVDYRLGDRRYRLPPRVTRTHETCRAGKLVIDRPGGEPAAETMPRDGNRFDITRDEQGRLQL